MKIENKDLIKITGGTLSISGSLLNSVGRMLESLMDVGRSLGTAIRMIHSNKSC